LAALVKLGQQSQGVGIVQAKPDAPAGGGQRSIVAASAGNGSRKLRQIGSGAVQGGFHGRAFPVSAPIRTNALYFIENTPVFME
jgi:hypothetical protein